MFQEGKGTKFCTFPANKSFKPPVDLLTADNSEALLTAGSATNREGGVGTGPAVLSKYLRGLDSGVDDSIELVFLTGSGGRILLFRPEDSTGGGAKGVFDSPDRALLPRREGEDSDRFIGGGIGLGPGLSVGIDNISLGGRVQKETRFPGFTPRKSTSSSSSDSNSNCRGKKSQDQIFEIAHLYRVRNIRVENIVYFILSCRKPVFKRVVFLSLL